MPGLHCALVQLCMLGRGLATRDEKEEDGRPEGGLNRGKLHDDDVKDGGIRRLESGKRSERTGVDKVGRTRSESERLVRFREALCVSERVKDE